MKKNLFLAVIFDMDGTLTRPALDFVAIRREIGVPAGDLVEVISGLPPEEQKRAWSIIESHEERAIHEQELQEGCRELLDKCRARSVQLGLVTRNNRRSVDHLCETQGLVFDGVVTREFPFMKPHPAPVQHLLTEFGLPPESALMVGDYIHDLDCGRAAGTRTCFFRNPGYTDYGSESDFAVNSMAELDQILFP